MRTDKHHPVVRFGEVAEYDAEGNGPAQVMGEEAFTRWVSGITRCVSSREVHTVRVVSELSMPLEGEVSPKLAVLTTRKHNPGMGREYRTWLKEKWLPAVKQSELKGYHVLRNVFGGDSRDWTLIHFVDNWAAFDEGHPVRRALGPEEFQDLVSDVGKLTGSARRLLLRYLPDLSFVN